MHLTSTIGSTTSARPAHSARTLALSQAPVLPTLLRLAGPSVLVMLAQSSTGLIEAHFVGKLGTPALAGMVLVVPGVMLMQMMSAGAVGGGWLALRLTGALAPVFLALGAGLLAMGVVNAAAVAGGAWFKGNAA